MQNTKENNKAYMKWLPELMAMLLLMIIRVLAVWVNGILPTGDMTLYEMAEIAGVKSGSEILYNSSYVYVSMLSVLLRFFGNKWIVAVIMQAVLLLVISILFYIIVRKLYGRVASIVFLPIAAVTPELMLGYTRITSDVLLVLVTGLVLFPAIPILSDKKESGKWECIVSGLVAGILTGALLWLDLFGIIVYLALIAGVLLPCKKGLGLKKLISIGCITIGVATILLSVYLMEKGLTESTLWEFARYYLEPYVLEAQLLPIHFSTWSQRDILSLLTALVAAVTVVLSSAGIFKAQVKLSAVAMTILLGIVGLRMMHMTHVSYAVMESICWLLVLGGILQHFVEQYTIKDAERKQAKVMEEGRNTTETVSVEEQPVQQTNYIPNPLPLPKKHVKKEIKFDYEPLPEQMEFDYELKEGEDDYDLK